MRLLAFYFAPRTPVKVELMRSTYGQQIERLREKKLVALRAAKYRLKPKKEGGGEALSTTCLYSRKMSATSKGHIEISASLGPSFSYELVAIAPFKRIRQKRRGRGAQELR